MKDMSLEELLKQYGYCFVSWVDKGDKSYKEEYYKFKAELLRRFESLKCCGNCEFGFTLQCPFWEKYQNERGDYPAACSYCDKWQTDGLTREEREK
jgi:hypothetical protein